MLGTKRELRGFSQGIYDNADTLVIIATDEKIRMMKFSAIYNR